MDISKNDIISMTVSLNSEGQGDKVDMILDNKSKKYNELLNLDVRYSKFWRITAGYKGTEVPIFTGRNFFLNIAKGTGANSLSLSILERNSFFEKARMSSNYYSNITLEDIITDVAKKYLGYTDAEIKIGTGFDTVIDSFVVNQESVIRKLRAAVNAFGGNLYNDAYGNFCVNRMYQTLSPVITYDKSLIQNYSFELKGVQDRYTDIEIVGRERAMDEVIRDDKEVCLGFQLLPVGLFAYPYVNISRRRFRNQFLQEKKGLPYSPEDDKPNISLITFYDVTQKVNIAGEFTPEPFTITSQTNEALKGIPSDVDIKYCTPEETEIAGKKTEYWKPAPGTYLVDILGFNDKQTFLRVRGYPTTNYPVILVSTYGYEIDDRYVLHKGIKIEDWKTSIIYEENKMKDLSHYHSIGHFEDPSGGGLLSDTMGAVNLKTYNLDFVNSDTLAETCLNYLGAYEYYQGQRFSMTIPFNPLIERNDLVQASLDKTVLFYVTGITHKIGSFCSTELRGVIKNVNDSPWI